MPCRFVLSRQTLPRISCRAEVNVAHDDCVAAEQSLRLLKGVPDSCLFFAVRIGHGVPTSSEEKICPNCLKALK